MTRATSAFLAMALVACATDVAPPPPPPPLAAPCVDDGCTCDAEPEGAGLVRCGDACVDVADDDLHCGGCGIACDESERCQEGACRCPGAPDFDTDPAHCGGCGHACPPAHRCEAGACICEPGPVTFTGDVQPIFDASCVASKCHDGVEPKGQLDLRAGASYDALVGVTAFQTGASCPPRPRVAPGAPEGSYLVAKVLGQGTCFGARMPPSDPLPMASIEAIVTWVCNGAPPD